MTNPLTLDHLRLAGMRVLAGMGLLLALVTLGGCLFATVPGAWFGGLLGALLAVTPCVFAMQGRIDGAARITAAGTLLAMPAVMLFVFRGSGWQGDLHMLFFATLAMVAILCDWRSILTGTLVVAVHHLLFGMVLPDWVFGETSSIFRILLHAAILIAEAGTLVWLAERIVGLIAAIDRHDEQRKCVEAQAVEERARQARAVAIVVRSLGSGLSALAEGDLMATIEEEYPEAYTMLRSDFNAALASLRGLIAAVGETAISIEAGSGKIAQAAEDLARRTEGNAASLEETSAAMAQIDGRLAATAAAASRTVERADQAMATVQSGRTVAVDAVEAMGRVADSAKGIDSVIEGLDKIAFQTRVLAMNAAVEAGRAGDAGRGFAVVADLVSALAMRAEEEAKRARDQLTVTQSEIASAVGAVHKVDGALSDISGNVAQVHELLGTMTADNQAQLAAVNEVTVAIGSMDQATQQNAAMVEQTSASARNLANQIVALTEQAARFKVTKGADARGSSANAANAIDWAVGRIDAPRQLSSAAIAALTRPGTADR